MREDGDESAIIVPVVIRSVIVGVEPLTIVITVGVEQIGITVGIVQHITFDTAHRVIFGLNLIWHLQCLNMLHQVSLFFKRFVRPPFAIVITNALNVQMLVSAAGNLGHGQDSPSTAIIIA